MDETRSDYDDAWKEALEGYLMTLYQIRVSGFFQKYSLVSNQSISLKERWIMPRLKEIEIGYEQIKDLVLQLDFKKRMKLIKKVMKEKNMAYRI